jgi:hypothetical protein
VIRVKKFLANLFLFLSVLLNAAVIVPLNERTFSEWNLSYPIITDNELYIKAGIAGLMFVFALIFFIVSLGDQRNYGEVKRSVSQAAIVPMWLYGVSIIGYAGLLQMYRYLYITGEHTTPNLILLGGIGVGLLNAIAIYHLVSGNFRRGGALKKIFLWIFTLEILLAGGYAGYLMLQKFPTADYQDLNFKLYVAIAAAYLVFYVLHLIFQAAAGKRELADAEEIPASVQEQAAPTEHPAPERKPAPAKFSKKDLKKAVPEAPKNRTIIVDKNQQILSESEKTVDPTSMLFEEVEVDPEFNRTANLDKQVSSIEYYIEKPKMFKPLDPTFDQLVAYVRELPNTVTKLAEDRITFYLDRKPFLVLMNFGNYYRMAFRSELEKGIRMIIKYPTISKNKGTKEDLWFKANNYGDLPKEIVYDIVKSAFDNVHS